jgi:hypothetical protein
MSDAGTRRLRPIHVVIIAVLLVAFGVIAYEWAHIAPTVVGQSPPATPQQPRTTPQQAQAGAEGRSRDGANPSQDAYTAQNQSRDPAGPR